MLNNNKPYSTKPKSINLKKPRFVIQNHNFRKSIVELLSRKITTLQSNNI